jgi:REP element-mobilizing transposase RayT
MVIAHHLVLSGYGTWLSNDVRGSGSEETRKDALRDLGPVHRGRRVVQPSRDELRAFFREANPLLDFRALWFDGPTRDAIGAAFGRVAVERRYTVWACAVCRNHGHLCVRVHRDDAIAMRDAFANAARAAVLALGTMDPCHPVWSSRPYKVFLDTPDAVRAEVDYIRKNPAKEGLPEQHWEFVRPYDGWPFHKRRVRR